MSPNHWNLMMLVFSLQLSLKKSKGSVTLAPFYLKSCLCSFKFWFLGNKLIKGDHFKRGRLVKKFITLSLISLIHVTLNLEKAWLFSFILYWIHLTFSLAFNLRWVWENIQLALHCQFFVLYKDVFWWMQYKWTD